MYEHVFPLHNSNPPIPLSTNPPASLNELDLEPLNTLSELEPELPPSPNSPILNPTPMPHLHLTTLPSFRQSIRLTCPLSYLNDYHCNLLENQPNTNHLSQSNLFPFSSILTYQNCFPNTNNFSYLSPQIVNLNHTLLPPNPTIGLRP